MNGRIYDPQVGRFLSADPHIAQAFNLQNYDRYAYVLNNPMASTDPTGLLREEWKNDDPPPPPVQELPRVVVTGTGINDGTICKGTCIAHAQGALGNNKPAMASIGTGIGAGILVQMAPVPVGLKVAALVAVGALICDAHAGCKQAAGEAITAGADSLSRVFSEKADAADKAAEGLSTEAGSEAKNPGAGHRGDDQAGSEESQAGKKKGKEKDQAEDEVKGGHRKGARASTKDKHEEADARRKRDQERKKRMGFKY